MLYRPTHADLPRQRMSPTALATAGALHVALLWLLLQYSPLQQAVRYVVYQYVQPISPAPAPAVSSRAITIRPPVTASPPDSAAVFSRTPESSVPLKTTTQLPDTVQAKQPVAAPRPAVPAPVVEPPSVEPAPPRAEEVPRAAPPEPVVVPAPSRRFPFLPCRCRSLHRPR